MKKHTRLIMAIFFASVLALSTAATVTSFAAASEERCDVVFNQTIQQILEEENIASGQVVSEKRIVHDMALEPSGYVYDFSIHTIEGYVIVINDGEFYTATEVYLNSKSPYLYCRGTAVYPYESLYLDYQDGSYQDLQNGNVLTSRQVMEICNIAYLGTTDYDEYWQETISYSYKNKDELNLAKIIPSYFKSGVNGGCVAMAAANIIWFYDRYYDNLIPNFTAGRTLGSYYLYNGLPNADFHNMWATINSAMGTSSSGETNIPGFKTGMQLQYLNAMMTAYIIIK